MPAPRNGLRAYSEPPVAFAFDVDRWKLSAPCAEHLQLFLEAEYELDDPTRRSHAATDKARTICGACPLIEQCTTDWRATETGKSSMRSGMRGGLTPTERARAARGSAA